MFWYTCACFMLKMSFCWLSTNDVKPKMSSVPSRVTERCSPKTSNASRRLLRIIEPPDIA